MKYIDDFKKHFAKFPVIYSKDVYRFLKSHGASYAYTKLFIHNAIKNRIMYRLVKGVYSFNEEATLVVFAFYPAYLGLQDALSIHNLWDQETNPVILTSAKVRSGVRKVLGRNVVVKRIDKSMMFGYEIMEYGGVFVPVSSIEKTLIDFVYFKQNLPLEVKKKMIKKINKKRMNELLQRLPKKISEKVVKYISC